MRCRYGSEKDDGSIIIPDDEVVDKLKRDILKDTSSTIDYLEMRIRERNSELGVYEIKLKEAKQLMRELLKVKSLSLLSDSDNKRDK